MATADDLARLLSARTGSTFVVLRGRPPLRVVPGRVIPNKIPPMRYGLRIERPSLIEGEPHTHTFQSGRPLTLRELTSWLASIADMIDMGFIPTHQPGQVPVEPEILVQVTDNHGGYLGGRCLVCHATGWLDGKMGYRHGTNVMGNRLIHTEDCPVGHHAATEEID